MKSTIVIPNYNGIQYLAACLDSLLADEYQGQLLVVDNASTDGSYELLEKYPMVKAIRLDHNTGFCGAVNAGIRAAETEYVILLNNDVEVEKGFVKELEKAMDDNPKAFSGNAQMRMLKAPEYMDNAGDYYCALGWAYDYGKGKKAAPKYQKPRRIFAACAGAAIYRKEIFEQIGLFDEKHFAYLEDVDIGYRARIYGYENIYIPGAIVYHAGSGASGSKYNAFKTNLSSRNSIYLIVKNMPLFQIVLNLPFLLLGFMVKTGFFILKGMGRLYIKGLGKGFYLYYKEGGKTNHVPFKWTHLWNYVKIQWELWINIIRRFFG
ncbi:MAG: glycosyltransferase family 2 protein [Lachnospiraceae bacterium]|nr:glycosyltransferase family 2 protein [Lachnospiraceae bacterium]